MEYSVLIKSIQIQTYICMTAGKPSYKPSIRASSVVTRGDQVIVSVDGDSQKLTGCGRMSHTNDYA